MPVASALDAVARPVPSVCSVRGDRCCRGLAGCNSTFGQKSPATKQSRSMSDLWRGGVMTALVVGAIVLSLIIFTVLRYRAAAATTCRVERQYIIRSRSSTRSSRSCSCSCCSASRGSCRTRSTRSSKNPDVTIDVQGFQWQWQFHYRNEDVTVTGVPDHRPVMVLPVNETIRLVLTSRDVIHSFDVPAFLFKRDVIPTITNQFDIHVEKAGTSGATAPSSAVSTMPRMTFTVRAVSNGRVRRLGGPAGRDHHHRPPPPTLPEPARRTGGLLGGSPRPTTSGSV